MNISAEGLDFIRSYERLALRSYQDSGGVWSIGYGHTDGVKAYQTCTQDQAEQWLEEDVAVAEHAVVSLVKIGLTQNEYDALVSLVFNVGYGSLARSELLIDLNTGRIAMAADEFLSFDHVGGIPNAGVERRRIAERTMFISPALLQ